MGISGQKSLGNYPEEIPPKLLLSFFFTVRVLLRFLCLAIVAASLEDTFPTGVSCKFVIYVHRRWMVPAENNCLVLRYALPNSNCHSGSSFSE